MSAGRGLVALPTALVAAPDTGLATEATVAAAEGHWSAAMNINLARYVTMQEAAALCGCSVDKIKAWLAAGRLEGTRIREGDGRKTKEIPLAALVAAGLLDPATLPQDISVEDLLPRSRAERDLQQVKQDLALARIKLEATEQALVRADRDATAWRRIAETLSKNGGRI